jgi:lipopolysaccharide export LptBFGC system permease protein LptF
MSKKGKHDIQNRRDSLNDKISLKVEESRIANGYSRALSGNDLIENSIKLSSSLFPEMRRMIDGIEIADSKNIDEFQNQNVNNKISSKVNNEQDEKLVFIKERTRLHELFIKEKEKTKRITLILAVILILAAVFLFIIAPKDKEIFSYIVCGILFIFAAGVFGFARVKGKLPFTEFEVDT